MVSKTGSKDVDNVDSMNAFLAMIGGATLPKDHLTKPIPIKRPCTQEQNLPYTPSSSFDQAKSTTKQDFDDEVILNPNSRSDSGVNTAAVPSRETSTAASPAAGTRAPPPTPASRGVAHDSLTAALEPIEEDDTNILSQLADESDLTLNDSKYARQVQSRYLVKTATPTYGQQTGSFSTPEFRYSTNSKKVRGEMIPKTAQSEEVEFYTDNVLANFKKQAEEKVKGGENRAFSTGKENNSSVASSCSKSTDAIPFPLHEEQTIDYTKLPTNPAVTKTILSTEQHPHGFSLQATEFVPSSPTAVNSHKSDTTSDQWGPETHPQCEAVAADVAHAGSKMPKAALTNKVAGLDIPSKAPNIVVTSSSDNETDAEEDREHKTHFKSWGAPVARDKPRARVRKVILSNLPANTDLTLVQSLISGGAIDQYVLAPSGGVAYVTFTTSEACDKFYEKYPNGISIPKFKARPATTVYVDKAKDVDVVSGMLQGHLECRASRCVRATCADEDWGMTALRRLAEGKTRKGKVENIIDTWRNNLRTIIFRFTSISDAVAFRGILLRDEDWDACNIQFMDDPCETATGVHLE